MGAKQSKRSVDISGKEAEGAREVAGAGGEGRLEPLADADTLKPQLNGDAHHIHTPDQQTDKEKQLDNGTPENEKDATTEKEDKEKEKESETEKTATLTNGDSESAPEAETVNGSDAPAAGQEVAKKPKKEKVKKKWSLRSISFSRKDKPKQDKKQKEEEPKTNGEPEKVPEEAPENAVEAEPTKAIEETKKALENGEEKTPETPVTEPLTNGSSTPESPKIEIPKKEGSVAPIPDSDVQKDAPKSELALEPTPVNGVSPMDSKDDVAITEIKSEEIKNEETPAVAPEVPASENSVQKEVCVEQMPLIEPTPPPLPANPPPSSVASFAETTMALHAEQTPLGDALTPAVLSPALIAHAAVIESICADQLINNSPVDSAPMPKDLSEHNLAECITTDNNVTAVIKNGKENQITPDYAENLSLSFEANEAQNVTISKFNDQIETNVTCSSTAVVNNDNERIDINLNDVPSDKKTNEDCMPSTNFTVDESVNLGSIKDMGRSTEGHTDKFTIIGREEPTISDKVINEIKESVLNPNCIISSDKAYVEITCADDSIEHENIINKNKTSEESEENKVKDLLEKGYAGECNGNIEETKQLTTLPLDSDVMESVNMATTPDDSVAALIAELPPPEDESTEHRDERHDSNEGSESFPAPPSDLDSVSSATSPEPQEPIPVNEEIAEMSEKVTPEVIADITATVETVTLQETSTDVAVAN